MKSEMFQWILQCHDLRVVNTYFKKAETHRITYKSGGRKSQIDYIMCRSDEKRNIKDCKVFLGESVTSQHTPLVCTLSTTRVRQKFTSRVPKTRWWKLADQEIRRNFADQATKKLQKRIIENAHQWDIVTEDLRELAEKVLGKTSGKSNPGKETWWWNEEVQKSI